MHLRDPVAGYVASIITYRAKIGCKAGFEVA